MLLSKVTYNKYICWEKVQHSTAISRVRISQGLVSSTPNCYGNPLLEYKGEKCDDTKRRISK